MKEIFMVGRVSRKEQIVSGEYFSTDDAGVARYHECSYRLKWADPADPAK